MFCLCAYTEAEDQGASVAYQQYDPSCSAISAR